MSKVLLPFITFEDDGEPWILESPSSGSSPTSSVNASDDDIPEPEHEELREAMADVRFIDGLRVLQSDSDSDSDVLLVLDEEWEMLDLPVVATPPASAIHSRPVAPVVERPPRLLMPAAMRRERRAAAKIEIGSWRGRSLYLNLTQTYGVYWKDMRAVCLRHSGSCSLSRSCRRGRPLGLLVAWLLHAQEDVCESKQIHRSFNPSYEQRVAARHQFKLMEGSEQWLSAEASAGDGPEEPLDCA